MAYRDIDYDEPDSIHPTVEYFYDEMNEYKNILRNQVYVIMNYLYGNVEFDKDKLVSELEDLCGLVDLDYNVLEELAIEPKKEKTNE